MKIYRPLKGSPNITIEFEKPNDVKNNEIGKKQENQMSTFKRKQEFFKFPATSNQQIDKFQKRILAFSNQYGPKHEKTTSIHMNYLESVREAGVTCLKNKDLQKAAFFLAECLSFRDPVHDEIFYEKFLIVKIDAVNKLMYCIFEMQNWKNDFKQNKSQRKGQQYHPLAKALRFMNAFLKEITQFPKYENLKKSEHCLLQMNYFYLGRLNRKNHNNRQAIIQFQIASDLIRSKLTTKFYLKNELMRNFMINIQIKIHYKLSKCFREEQNFTQQANCERKALQEARIHNQKLFVYISRKVTFFKRKRQFLLRLEKLDGRKRIEEEILKLIDQSKQNEISSLYDAYLHEQFDQ